MKISFDKKVLKDRKQSLCYWGINLSITIIATLSNNGFYTHFISRINTIRDSTEWLFWLTMGVLVLTYISWCVVILYKDVMSIMSLNPKLSESINDLRILPIIEELPIREKKFLQRITNQNKINKIAFAITLKDFVKERNESICHSELNPYIPTYGHILNDTEMSLHSLISALSLMSRYESDKYYNSKLIMFVGNDMM